MRDFGSLISMLVISQERSKKWKEEDIEEEEDILGKSDRNRNNWFHSRTSGIECAWNGSSRCPSACVARERENVHTNAGRMSISIARDVPRMICKTLKFLTKYNHSYRS